MLTPGDEIELTCDKAVPGGRMLGRHQGQVVLVAGTIPGERIRARVDRAARQVAYARTVEVLEAHPDRRPTAVHWACGGSVYAHIEYSRQLALKADIVADAFARIAKVPLASRVQVAASEERGYRMRARLHVRDGRIGFFREGTHDLCDAAATGQLLPATVDVIEALGTRVRLEPFADVRSIELAENVPADQRVIHVEVESGRSMPGVQKLADLDGISGLTCGPETEREGQTLGGSPLVTDLLSVDGPAGGTSPVVRLQHHVRSFFQGNRWLLQRLVSRVLAHVPGGEVIDLYAGVGLFGVSLAARGGASVVAVEGDRVSAADLRANAAPYGDAIRVHCVPVEDYLQRAGVSGAGTIIVDPPRTGMSRRAVASLLARNAPRVVYVSCDLATIARDVRSFLDRGYRLDHLEALDLFPNTAHVETLAVLASTA